MPYRPKKLSNNVSPKGRGRIVKLPDRTLGVQFSDDADKEFAGKKYKVSKWPDYIKPNVLPGNEWYIRLNSKGDELFSIAPVVGEFVGHCIGLAREEGQKPVPKFKNDQWNGYNYFIALIEITEGPCEGMIIAYNLRYYFGEDLETGNADYIKWSGQNPVHAPKLDEFMTVTGAWNAGEIKFSENILPIIHTRVVREDKTFKFLMKDGWIDRLWPITSVQTSSDEELWQEDGWETGSDNTDAFPTPEEPETVEDAAPWDDNSEDAADHSENEEFSWD